MNYFFFFASLQFLSFGCFAVTHPIINLEENIIYLNNNSAEFSVRYPSQSSRRIFGIALKNANGDLVSADIGNVQVIIPSEKIYFEPTQRIVHKVEHNRRIIINVSVNRPPESLFLYLTTEEYAHSKYRMQSLRIPLIFRVFKEQQNKSVEEESICPIEVTEQPLFSPVQELNQEMDIDKPGLPSTPPLPDLRAQINPISLMVFSKEQRSSPWTLDRRKWTAYGTNEIGKMRKIEIIGVDDASVTISLISKNNLLFLSAQDRGGPAKLLTINPQKAFYLRVVSNAKIPQNDVYTLVIETTTRRTFYQIELKSHHYESRHRRYY